MLLISKGNIMREKKELSKGHSLEKEITEVQILSKLNLNN